MTPEQAEQLIGGYATGTLTKSERRELCNAAIDNDVLFEALVEEEELKGVLADPDFRLNLRRRLRELNADVRPSFADRVRVLLRPQWIVVASLAASIAVILLIRSGTINETSTVARVVLSPGTVPALHAAGILEEPTEHELQLTAQSRSEPPQTANGSWISLDRAGAQPKYHAGDRMRIGFFVPANANVLLVEERADGTTYRLYPNRFQSAAKVSGGAAVLIPPAGQGDLTVEGPAGPRMLRLLVFPPSTDPLADGTNWSTIRPQARLLEQRYEVQP